MSRKIHIREMLESDWHMVSVIYKQGIKMNDATFEQECPVYESWDKNHLKQCRLVITVDDHVAGWTALSSISKRSAYRGVAEISIYIKGDEQGKGLGKLLLSRLCKESELCGFWTLQANIIEQNEASIHLHKTCGFRVVGSRIRIAKDSNGIWRNTILAERRIKDDMDDNGGKLKVAFICVHNSCRSQIAEALGRFFYSDLFESYSAGTIKVSSINRDAVRLMKKLYHIDMEEHQYSKLIKDIRNVDIVITMGCNVECPNIPCRYKLDWGLEDPSGKDDEAFLSTIISINEKLYQFASDIRRNYYQK